MHTSIPVSSFIQNQCVRLLIVRRRVHVLLPRDEGGAAVLQVVVHAVVPQVEIDSEV